MISASLSMPCGECLLPAPGGDLFAFQLHFFQDCVMKRSEESSCETDGTEGGSGPCHSLSCATLAGLLTSLNFLFSSYESVLRMKWKNTQQIHSICRHSETATIISSFVQEDNLSLWAISNWLFSKAVCGVFLNKGCGHSRNSVSYCVSVET